jgi:type II secretory pathway pseudopilin PulG
MKSQRRYGFTPLEIKVSNGRSKKFLTGPVRKIPSNGAGFTVVEILTVLAIIAIMVGILVPTVSFVRNTAKEAKQRTQLAAIDMALMAFKGDQGDYPSSDVLKQTPFNYCGAQRLAEALVGWDLLGFHPDSKFIASNHVTDPEGVYNADDNINLDKRKGPYLELSTANAFKLSDLFVSCGSGTWALAPDTYVLCDVFGIKPVSYTTASGTTTTVMAGTPILYYKANTSSKLHNTGDDITKRIYSALDNKTLTELKIKDPGRLHPLAEDDGSFNFTYFYNYITDPKITARPWPYRPDSYILISAGVDGLYGTNDDICNF